MRAATAQARCLRGRKRRLPWPVYSPSRLRALSPCMPPILGATGGSLFTTYSPFRAEQGRELNPPLHRHPHPQPPNQAQYQRQRQQRQHRPQTSHIPGNRVRALMRRLGSLGMHNSGTSKQVEAILEEVRREGLPLNHPVYSVAVRVFAKRGLWRRAIGVLREIESCEAAQQEQQQEGLGTRGAPPDDEEMRRERVVTYTHLVNACGKAGHVQEALQLAEEMESKGLKPNEVTYSILMKALGRSGLHSKALDLLSEMQEKGVQPDCVVYNVAISLCAKTGNYERALQILLRDMPQAGVAPDVLSYDAAMDACAKAERPNEAMELLEEMRRGGEERRRVAALQGEACGESVVDEVAGSGGTAAEREAARRRTPRGKMGSGRSGNATKHNQPPAPAPHTSSFNAAMHACARSGMYRWAMALFLELEEQQLRPTRHTFNIAMHACSKVGECDTARSLLNKMKASGDPELWPDSITYNTAISTYANKGMVAPAMELLREMEEESRGARKEMREGGGAGAGVGVGRPSGRDLRPDRITYNSVLFACDRASVLAAQEVEKSDSNSESDSSRAEKGNGQQQQQQQQQPLEVALALLEEMRNGGGQGGRGVRAVRPDYISYHSALKTCRGAKGSSDTMLQLLAEMRERGCPPQTLDYNLVIDTLRRAKEYGRALDLWRGMGVEGAAAVPAVVEVEDKGGEPTGRFRGGGWNGRGKGNSDDGMVRPNAETLNVVLDCLEEAQMHEEADRQYAEALHSGLRPSHWCQRDATTKSPQAPRAAAAQGGSREGRGGGVEVRDTAAGPSVWRHGNTNLPGDVMDLHGFGVGASRAALRHALIHEGVGVTSPVHVVTGWGSGSGSSRAKGRALGLGDTAVGDTAAAAATAARDGAGGGRGRMSKVREAVLRYVQDVLGREAEEHPTNKGVVVIRAARCS